MIGKSAKEVFEQLKRDAIAKGLLAPENQNEETMIPTLYPGLKAPEQINISKMSTNTTIEKFIENNIPIDEDKYPTIFRDLGYIEKNQKAKDDFRDDELKEDPAITLKGLSDEATCEIGKYVFSELTTTTSRSITAGILVLAFQLKKRGYSDMRRVYPAEIPDIFNTTKDINYDLLDRTKIIDLGTTATIIESDDAATRAKAYAFVSASMLRMFTRSPENFVTSWNHICRGFTTFYNKSFPISNFTPNLEVMKMVHRQFSWDDLMKSTLFRILYLSNESEQDDSLKRFLYEIHLCHTGMHILPITIKLCEALNCQVRTVLVYLWKGEYDRQITSLLTLLSWVVKTPEEKKRAMWRYGRIFSQNFMPSLQTKSCPKLVYILAAALKRERPVEHSGILEISQLQEISLSDKNKCDAAGRLLVKLVRKHVN